MSNASTYTPPADASGGYILMSYANPSYQHTMRIHVAPFNGPWANSSAWGGGSGAGDFSYVAAQGTETALHATMAAIAAAWAPYFDNTWSMALAAIYQMTASGPEQLFPLPAFTPVVGTGTNATTPNKAAGETIYNFKTLKGGRARLILVGAGNWSAQSPDNPTSADGWVSYLTGANTGVVAHDGSKYSLPCHRTFPYNRRLRRHYHQA